MTSRNLLSPDEARGPKASYLASPAALCEAAHPVPHWRNQSNAHVKPKGDGDKWRTMTRALCAGLRYFTYKSMAHHHRPLSWRNLWELLYDNLSIFLAFMMCTAKYREKIMMRNDKKAISYILNFIAHCRRRRLCARGNLLFSRGRGSHP